MTKEKQLPNYQNFGDNTLIHHDLIAIKNHLYIPSNFSFSQPEIEHESIEYGACNLELNGLSIKFRVAKITPTKVSLLWKNLQNWPV